jgi:hypothetical protein
MKTKPNPKSVATAASQPIQESLPWATHEADSRIPEQEKSECVALIRQMIEAVVQPGQIPAGGSND